MATSKTPIHTCWICGKEVRLEQCKIDESGLPVHEPCYVVRVRFSASHTLRTEDTLQRSHKLIEQTDKLLSQSRAIANRRFQSAWNKK